MLKKRKGKQGYLENKQTRDLIKKLETFFESTVEVPRIRVGKKQTVLTLINEEVLLFAKHLRNEHETGEPRIVKLEVN